MKAVFTLMLILSMTGQALAGILTGGGPGHAPFGGDPSPWPWGQELAFPWGQAIDGVWESVDHPRLNYVLQTKRVSRPIFLGNQWHYEYLVVYQYDSATCQIVGRGKGYEKDRFVSAEIHNNKGVLAYVMTLHAFAQPGIPNRSSALPFRLAMIRSSAGGHLVENAQELKKISAESKMICYDQP